jgi:colanic acid/amylovoran biosynthesis protein
MPRVCQALGTPLIAVGLSVWPIHGRLTRRLVRSTLAACIHVTARESSSRAEIEDLLAGRGPAVKQVPDLALAWLSQQEPDQNNSVPDAGALGVAVTLVDWSEFGRATRQDYVFSIAGYLDWLQTRYDLTVRIVPQVTKEWESADAITSDLIGAVSGKTRPAIQVVPPVSDPGDLVAIYRTADLLIATRMHSAIFALAVGTPVIAIPYDIGAKWQILGDLGIGDFLIPYPEITAEGLITRHRRLVTDGSAILDRVRANLEEQYTHLADNLGPLAR